MLSVIMYGRNDSHGYNLHKRAAISFNAIAEVMNHPDDEILFVDYNTPDDHPTFPEAIHDTLTEKARRIMRIFRVRPDQHLPLKARTHLLALEPQSRNVALRRSNPRNRWVLYTNTDMLLVPRDETQSLSDILAALPDGFYQTPRFELPEMLWEAAFDRRDPAGNLARLRDWSVRFRLNQVVCNSLPMRYDALGDFQAALREDMFAIHGFDEEMVLGWHCDSNVAARLALYRGAVDTLVDKVFGYHCDHTRVAAANNKGRDTTMNDLNRFLWDLATPYLPAQAERWGWPDLEIEEIRLDRDTPFERFFSGVGAAVEPAEAPYRPTSIDGPSDDLTYDLQHTLPFVCDQILTFPRTTAPMLVGARPEFLQRFATAWRGMGFGGPILVPRECAGLAADLPAGLAQVESGPLRELLPRAQLFIFEFGLATQRGEDPLQTGRRATVLDRERLAEIEKLFRQIMALEAETRPLGHGLPRRVIGINVIQNCYWSLFSDYVAANLNPFCGHVLAGDPREATSLKDRANRARDRRSPAAPISARLRVASGDAPPLRGKLGEASAR
jgi:hypothetical protein